MHSLVKLKALLGVKVS